MPQPFTSNRKPTAFRPSGGPRRPAPGPGNAGSDKPGANGARANGARADAAHADRAGVARPGADKPEHEILFQTYFKSVGPRTYAAQVKKASNGNHYVVLTEGKRDEKTGEVRKTRLFVYSEDFVPFFKMLQETAHFIKDHPLPEDVKKRRDAFWARKNSDDKRAPEAKAARGSPPKAAPAAVRTAPGRAPLTAAR